MPEPRGPTRRADPASDPAHFSDGERALNTNNIDEFKTLIKGMSVDELTSLYENLYDGTPSNEDSDEFKLWETKIANALRRRDILASLEPRTQEPDHDFTDVESAEPKDSVAPFKGRNLERSLEDVGRIPDFGKKLGDAFAGDADPLNAALLSLMDGQPLTDDEKQQRVDLWRQSLLDDVEAEVDKKTRSELLRAQLLKIAAVGGAIGLAGVTAATLGLGMIWVAGIPIGLRLGVGVAEKFFGRKSKDAESKKLKKNENALEILSSRPEFVAGLNKGLAAMVTNTERGLSHVIPEWIRVFPTMEGLSEGEKKDFYQASLRSARTYLEATEPDIPETEREKKAVALALHALTMIETNQMIAGLSRLTEEKDTFGFSKFEKLAQSAHQRYSALFGAGWERKMRTTTAKQETVAYAGLAMVTGLGMRAALRSEWAMEHVPVVRQVMGGMAGLGIGLALESYFKNKDKERFMKAVANEVASVNALMDGGSFTDDHRAQFIALYHLSKTLELPNALQQRIEASVARSHEQQVEGWAATGTSTEEIATQALASVLSMEDPVTPKQEALLKKINGHPNGRKIRSALLIGGMAAIGVLLPTMRADAHADEVSSEPQTDDQSSDVSNTSTSGAADETPPFQAVGEHADDVSQPPSVIVEARLGSSGDDIGDGMPIETHGEAGDQADLESNPEPSGDVASDQAPEPVSEPSDGTEPDAGATTEAAPQPPVESEVEIIHKNEGYEHAIRRLLERNPERYGWDSSKGDVHAWSGGEAHRMAIRDDIVFKNDEGDWMETRVRRPDEVGVQFEQDADGVYHVKEVLPSAPHDEMGTTAAHPEAHEYVVKMKTESDVAPTPAPEPVPEASAPEPQTFSSKEMEIVMGSDSYSPQEKIDALHLRLPEDEPAQIGDHTFIKRGDEVFLATGQDTDGTVMGTPLDADHLYDTLAATGPVALDESAEPVPEPEEFDAGETVATVTTPSTPAEPPSEPAPSANAEDQAAGDRSGESLEDLDHTSAVFENLEKQDLSGAQKLAELKSVVNPGERLTYNQALGFVRKGPDVYLDLGSNQGVLLTEENIDRLTRPVLELRRSFGEAMRTRALEIIAEQQAASGLTNA